MFVEVPVLCGQMVLCDVSEIMVDTGSNLSLIRSDICKYVNQDRDLDPCSVRIVSVNSSSLNVLGQISCNIEIDGRTCNNHTFIVAADIGPKMILGVDFLAKFGASVDFSCQPHSVHFQSAPETCDLPVQAVPVRACMEETTVVPACHVVVCVLSCFNCCIGVLVCEYVLS